MPDIFLYGTLRHPELFALVAGPIGAGARSRPARLPGWRVVRSVQDGLPIPVPAEGEAAQGVLWSELGPDALARLERYELPFGYRTATLPVETDGGRASALVYLPPDGMERTDQPWSLEAWGASHGAAACLVAAELASLDPPPGGAGLVRQWPMMRHRAEARLRAAREPAPADIRHAPRDGDFTIEDIGPPSGAFFRLVRSRIGHRRFDGAWIDGVLREVLIGADAALVLPYDAARDRVLLVEQFRSGPARRGDPNPWSLEPVAGIVDAGETPEEAAHRETGEEAGLTLARLTHMFDLYPSPGNSTDRFHCYLGAADLPNLAPWRGGLDEEHEDLRLHVLPREAALDLVASGEAQAGPLVAMLLWLDRARLRGEI